MKTLQFALTAILVFGGCSPSDEKAPSEKALPEVDGDLYWHRHLFHLRVDTYERIRSRGIPLDSIGVSEQEAKEMILASGNEHIKSILAGNLDGEEGEYDVAREMIGLGFSPGQISALPLAAVDSISKGLR